MKKPIDEYVSELETAERLRFDMDRVTKKMLTVPIKKKLHDTVHEKRNIIAGTYDTVPYGFDLTQLFNAR